MVIKLIVCLILLIPISATDDNKISDLKKSTKISKNKDFLQAIDCVDKNFFDIVQLFVPGDPKRNFEGRKRKKTKLNKYLVPLLVGFLLIKSVILPLTLKALAILSGKAVVLSMMSLILAAIIGLRTIANGHAASAQNKIDLDNMNKYKRKDTLDVVQSTEENPYKFLINNKRKRK